MERLSNRLSARGAAFARKIALGPFCLVAGSNECEAQGISPLATRKADKIFAKRHISFPIHKQPAFALFIHCTA